MRNYDLKSDIKGIQEIRMPQLAEVTGVSGSSLGNLVLWAQVDSEAEDTGSRRFIVTTTRRPVTPQSRFVGTVIAGWSRIHHVFEVIDGETSQE